MSEDSYRLFVGIDWGSEAHQVMVVDGARAAVHERRVRHTGSEVAALAHWLLGLANGVGAGVAVALEIPRGPVVDALLAAGLHVYAINPKQLDRFRDRFTVAGAKDDRRDARVLATSLVTDRAAFRRLDPDDARVVQLREVSRLEEDLEADLCRLSNRLREQLYRLAPDLLTLCPGADEPWLWALLEQMPTPAAAARISRAALARILAEHRIRRISADALLALVRAPAFVLAPGVVEAVADHIAVLLPRLRLTHDQQRQCAARVERLLEELAQTEEHRDVAILRSLPGIGRKVSATMLAEAAGLLAVRDYYGLRAHAGTAPLTKQSGKRREVHMRHGCNQRLRQAMHYWAQTSVRHDARAGAQYARLRARGCSHARALRGVADRLLAVLIAMLRSQTLYDPARRTAPVQIPG